MPSILGVVLLFGSAVVAGSLNAVAGGGTFLTFPSLIFMGVLPVNANATSTVALWPGQWASIAAYRRELAKHDRVLMIVLATASVRRSSDSSPFCCSERPCCSPLDETS